MITIEINCEAVSNPSHILVVVGAVVTAAPTLRVVADRSLRSEPKKTYEIPIEEAAAEEALFVDP
jgi:hypothetical protein